MTDFCIETTAIHEEYVNEYNTNYKNLFSILPNTQFICITTHPDKVITRPNLIVKDIREYTDTKFEKSYNQKGGFCEILQSTRFGLYEAYTRNYTKVIHLQTDMVFYDNVSEHELSNHFVDGVYFDMGGSILSEKLKLKDQKTVYLTEKYKPNTDEIYMGDDPVVFLKFETKEKFKEYLNNLDMLCKDTFNYYYFTTGIADELSFATFLTGIKMFIDYKPDSRQKFFDVEHNHLHVKHYNDRDPKTIR